MICRDYKGRTPVHFAAQSGHSGLLITLICAGGPPNSPDKMGYTPLHWAAYNGEVEDAKGLVASCASLFTGHEKCVDVLLEVGACKYYNKYDHAVNVP